jgi:hypothetical protein
MPCARQGPRPLKGRSRRRTSVAAPCCHKPGTDSRPIHRPRAPLLLKGARKSFSWTDYRDLPVRAHVQPGGPIVVVRDNLTTHLAAGRVQREHVGKNFAFVGLGVGQAQAMGSPPGEASPSPVIQEPTNQWAAWVRSAPSMPPRQLRVCHRLVMRSPEEHHVQALNLHPEFAGGPWRKHEQSVLQLVPGPPLATARAGELSLPLPPPAFGAVDTHGPHAQRHCHDARRQSLPFEHTDGGVRRSRQTWDIAIPRPGSSPAAFPRPK